MAWWAEARERSTPRPSSPGDGRVHVEHVAGGQGDVVQAIQTWMELCGEMSAHGVDGAPVPAENAIGAHSSTSIDHLLVI